MWRQSEPHSSVPKCVEVGPDKPSEDLHIYALFRAFNDQLHLQLQQKLHLQPAIATGGVKTQGSHKEETSNLWAQTGCVAMPMPGPLKI